MQVINETRRVALATRAERASNVWQRGLGLMGRHSLPEGYGLIIDPCKSIHMWFIRLSIDVCHVDGDHRVVRVLHAIQPWRIGPIVWKSRYVVELPAGTARITGTEQGDQLRLVDLT